MSDIKIKNPDAFADLFVEEYCQSGFGRMSKRDVDVLVFYLLLRDGRYKLPEQIFKTCRELKLTEAKVRNLYQEVQLRYEQYTVEEAKKRFVKLVNEGSFEQKGDKITFIVREPLLRQYFEEWVAENKGFTDSSFNKNLVTLHKDTFWEVLNYLAVKNTKEIQGKFSGELECFNEAKNRKGLIGLFTEEFVKSGGKETGALSVKGLALGLKALLLGSLE